MSEREPDSLDDRIVAHYERLEMDPDKVAALVGSGESVPAPARRALPRRRLLAAAAVAGLGLTGALVYRAMGTLDDAQRADEARLVNELLLNHRRAARLDVAADSIEAIASGLPDVPLPLSVADRLPAGYRLVGGRYCTLLGESAVQLRLEHPSTRREATAIVAALTPSLARLDGLELEVDDATVVARREGGAFVTWVR